MVTAGTSESACRICGSKEMAVFAEIADVPAYCNLLWPTRRKALDVPRGDIRLAFCGECGHIFNLAFDPDLLRYTEQYENSLHFSPRFQDYATSLATRLIERYDLYGKDIIEIGCGQGEFLNLLCERGNNRGLGFDPSYAPHQTGHGTSERFTVIQEGYSERHAAFKADFICCRHTLEHVHDPAEFLVTVRRAIGSRLNITVFFEVPNMRPMLNGLAIWDIIYEHCSYFSGSSLARLFTACGFDPRDLTEAFDGQFLCIEASPREGGVDVAINPGAAVEELADEVAAFAEHYRSKVETWRSHLGQIERAGDRAVVWGAGSKGVSFLNSLSGYGRIEYVVDLNPRKQGSYVSGTGQQIVPPDFLRAYQPHIVIVMNPIYTSEIRLMAQSLGLTAQLLNA